jgi:hypothetical protein
MSQAEHLRAIRFWIAIVILGLVLSGLSAFPIETELRWIQSALQTHILHGVATSTGFLPWIARVLNAYALVNHDYPFLAYGTDWLGFAHLVIAFAFVGAYRDPLRNEWLLTFGFIACAGVLPLAVLAGAVRGIPWGWTMIDCSFALFCALPLLNWRKHLKALGPEASPALRRVLHAARRGRKISCSEAESWLR